jgi:pimeloyl-ACP methyl ester carboxylesterase
MFRTFILFILLSLPFFSIAQRTLPYPIILVHGWTGDAETWTDFTKYLESKASLSIEPLNFWIDLNSDNNIFYSEKYSDVGKYGRGKNIGNHDVYVVDFAHGGGKNVSNLSNQQGIAKQGLGLKYVIEEVLKFSGAEKVSLLGHSMGGLAIREYLQNQSNWVKNDNHCVAKIVTIGTPHGGSNFGSADLNIGKLFGNDERSESVRDLRTSYKTGYDGVYLFGGFENSNYIRSGFNTINNFYNLDVNCNGRTGDRIIGLNQKSIPSDLDYACIIANDGTASDLIVTAKSQNLKNYYSNLPVKIFNYDCNGAGFICHTDEPKKAIFEMIQALDEPEFGFTNLKYGYQYKGFLNKQSNGSNIDSDDFNFTAFQKGVYTFSGKAFSGSNTKIKIKDLKNEISFIATIDEFLNYKFTLTGDNNLYINFTGDSKGGWATYNFKLDFCPLPTDPIVSSTSSTTFCENDVVELLTGGGYDSYNWLKDNQNFAVNTTKIKVSTSGNYSVRASACGLSFASTNNLQVTVKPLPLKPILTQEDQPDKFVITASTQEGLEWFLNGVLVPNQKNAILIPEVLGKYSVKTSKDGCSTISDIVNVKMDKPILEYEGKNETCNGDSILLKGPLGFSNYIFENGSEKFPSIKNQKYFNKDGNYSIVTQRGKFSSEPSLPQKIVFNPIPEKPKIIIDNYILKSNIASTYQWYFEGKPVLDSIKSTLKPFEFGKYQVEISEKSCSNISDFIYITAIGENPDKKVAKIYPNPNEGKVWVEFFEKYLFVDINIFDLTGRLIKNQYFSEDFKRIVNLNLSLPGGIYILNLRTERNSQKFKLVIR